MADSLDVKALLKKLNNSEKVDLLAGKGIIMSSGNDRD